MKHTCKKRRERGRSPGRKEKRKRAAKALAVAGAIAGGTQAYAAPVRFDNPAQGEPGHFDWATPNEGQSRRWLDVTLDATSQPSGVSDVISAFGQSGASVAPDYGEVKARDHLGTAGFQLGGYYDYVVVGVASGESIPNGFVWGARGLVCYYGCETPEGEASYLGVEFDLGAGTQYGWIGVVRTGTRLATFAWGYETEASVAIEAGAPGEGACCGPGPCQEITEADCEAMGWKYIGDGITCEQAACNNIPTVSEWGLAVMSLALLAAGAWVVRKRIPQPKPPAAA